MGFKISDEGWLFYAMVVNSKNSIKCRRLFDSLATCERFYKFRGKGSWRVSLFRSLLGVIYCRKGLDVITSCLLNMITTIRIDTLSLKLSFGKFTDQYFFSLDLIQEVWPKQGSDMY